MNKASSADSVDLTDEDSTETIIGDETSNQPYLISNTIPPPLTPINTFSDFQNNMKSSGNQQLPPLKNIKSLSSSSPNSPTQLRTNMSEGTICLETGDEGKINFSFSPSHSTQFSPKISSKVVIIKKNDKYYRVEIPHNVMPAINQSSAPVYINIPGVGPLVIKIDPRAKEQNTSHDQLEPFSLNFDEIMESASVQTNHAPEIVNEKLPNTVKRRQIIKDKLGIKDLLADNKFCWTFPKYRSIKSTYFKDYLGFTKAESYKARKCYGTLEKIVNKKRTLYQNSLKTSKLSQQKTGHKNAVQQIKRNESVESVNNKVCMQRLETSCIPEPLTRLDIQNVSLPPNMLISAVDDYNAVSTNKFSILDVKDNEKSISDPRLNLTKRSPQKAKEKSLTTRKNLTQLCTVQLTRDEHIDQLYQKVLKKNGKIDNSNNNVKRNSSPSQESLEDNQKMYKSKLIQHPRAFLKQMSSTKPLLILNELNFDLVKYSVEFSNCNIVYPVNPQRPFPNTVLSNADFVNAVKSDYVKFVDQDLICKFIKGEHGP